MTRLPVGLITLAAGIALWLSARLERAHVPAWMPRLAIAVAALGLSTLAATRNGLGWSVSSISFSVIAIILLLTVIRDTLRR
jgi:hypothetical protein